MNCTLDNPWVSNPSKNMKVQFTKTGGTWRLGSSAMYTDYENISGFLFDSVFQ